MTKIEKHQEWFAANQRYLAEYLVVVHDILDNHISDPEAGARPEHRDSRHLDTLRDIANTMHSPPSIESICNIFKLSEFERYLLLLCVGIELDAKFAVACANVHNDHSKPFPTFNLALALLPEAHWSALSPTAPLRYWRLVEIKNGSVLTTNPLRIDERILNYLVGVHHIDARLQQYLESVPETATLVESHLKLANQIFITIKNNLQTPIQPVIQLIGRENTTKKQIASAVCQSFGLSVSVIPGQYLPSDITEISAFIRLLLRETLLNAGVYLIDCDTIDSLDHTQIKVVNKLARSLNGIVFLASRDPQQISGRPSIIFEVCKPTRHEQKEYWQTKLGKEGTKLNGHLETLISQFDMNLQSIESISYEVLGKINSGIQMNTNKEPLHDIIWDTCRIQSRPQLENLAQFIEPKANWDNLILPKHEKEILKEISTHMRRRAKVYENWGFAQKSARGLGISALFAGASGTGKTMAAEVLANEFRLDIYRIDLSSVVSKYIGETEKNLRRIFDAAENSGVILLFDEADALFGKRSDVKDSHDRYANIEVSYLLQRMEAYRGLAILTSNRKSALDSAFLRRIRFIVNFPFPDASQRAEIWQGVFPGGVPLADLDVFKLARLNIAGGNIHNIALRAAFLAADENQAVEMGHLLRAARSEYAKIEKSLTEAEIRDWV